MTAKVRRNGAYAPLGANYADDDAVTTLDVAENDRAELLYVRSLAYCARDLRTEGFVSDVALDAGKVLRRSKGRRGVDTILAAANTLVDLGLWDKVEGGYVISAWLKWNKSWEEVSGERRTDAARKRRQAPVESETTPPGVHPESEGTPPGLVAPKHVTSRQSTSRQSTAGKPAAVAASASGTETAGQRLNRLTRTYTDVVRLSNFTAVQGVVKKAITAGHSDEKITAALASLVQDGRAVTADSLRIALEGPPRQSGRRGHPALDQTALTYDPHLEHLANW